MAGIMGGCYRVGMIVCPLHWYWSPTHLDEVKRDMERLGAPRLRGYLDPVSGAFMLREGTHRIRAAQALGIAPTLIHQPWTKTRQALENARMAAVTRGLRLPKAVVLGA